MPILVGLVTAGLVSAGLVGDIAVCVDLVGVKVVDGIVDIELELVDGVIAVEAKPVEELTLGEGIVLVSVELPGPLVDGLPTALLDPLEPIGPLEPIASDSVDSTRPPAPADSWGQLARAVRDSTEFARKYRRRTRKADRAK